MARKSYKKTPDKWWVTALWMMLLLLLIAVIVAYDVFRWHVFQDATDSDVSYWKWRLWIDVRK